LSLDPSFLRKQEPRLFNIFRIPAFGSDDPKEFFNFEDGPEFLFQADAIFSSLFF